MKLSFLDSFVDLSLEIIELLPYHYDENGNGRFFLVKLNEVLYLLDRNYSLLILLFNEVIHLFDAHLKQFKLTQASGLHRGRSL